MHDVQIILGGGLIEQIIGAYYWTGRIPSAVMDRAHRNPAVPITTLELYFSEPSVRLTERDGAIIAQFAQWFVARAVNIAGEQSGTLSFPIPITTILKGDGADQRQFIRIDPAAVPVEAITVTEGLLPLYINIMRFGVRNALANLPPIDINVTPERFPNLRGELRVYDVQGSSLQELRFPATIDGRPVDTPKIPSGPATLPAWAHPVSLQYPIMMEISGDFILGRVHQALAQKGVGPGAIILDNIDKKILDLSVGGDVTFDTGLDNPFLPSTITAPLGLDFSPTIEAVKLLSALTVELWGPGLRFSGRIEVIIDNWFDTDVDFKIGIGIEKRDDGFHPVITFVNADVDTDVLAALSGILGLGLGLIVAAIIDDALDSRVSKEIGKQNIPFTFEVPNLIQTAEISGSNDPKLQINVEVRPVEFGIWNSVQVTSMATLRYEREDIQSAPYVYGNMKSLKVHYGKCRFGGLMSPKNRKDFQTLEEAIELGYDLCRWCKPLEEGGGFLRVRLIYERTRKASPTQRFRVTATRTSGPKSKYLTEMKLEETSYLHSRNVFKLMPLANGHWMFRIVDGDWQIAFDKPLVNAGRWIELKVRQS